MGRTTRSSWLARKRENGIRVQTLRRERGPRDRNGTRAPTDSGVQIQVPAERVFFAFFGNLWCARPLTCRVGVGVLGERTSSTALVVQIWRGWCEARKAEACGRCVKVMRKKGMWARASKQDEDI